jgi:hypothetical protein
MSASIKVTSPVKRRKGNKESIVQVTTAKGTSDGPIWNGTIKRTLDGKSGSLQIKSRRNASDELEILHMHCLSDGKASEFSRNTGTKIDDFFVLRRVGATGRVLRIGCKRCGREWFNDGFNFEISSPDAEHPKD